MTRNVFLTPRAEEDILAVAERIHQQYPLSASRWFSQLMSKIEGLSHSAEWYGLADEADELGIEIREMYNGKRSSRYRILSSSAMPSCGC